MVNVLDFIRENLEIVDFEYIETHDDLSNVFGYDMGAGKVLFKREVFDESELTEECEEWLDSNTIELIPFRPTDVDDLKQKICEYGYELINVFDGKGQDFISACIGINNQNGRAVYDYNLMIGYMLDNGVPLEEAYDWIDYNTLRALPYYKNSPYVIDFSEIMY